MNESSSTGSVVQHGPTLGTFIQILLAIFLPPVGVFLKYGLGVEFWIDLVLTLLGYLPGIIYAVYVIVV